MTQQDTEAVLPNSDASIRSLIPLYGIIFLIGTETFLISPLLPSISHEFNVSASTTAQIVVSYVLTYAITAPILGSLSDKIGRRQLVFLGGLLFVASNAFASYAQGLHELTLARVITGLAASMAGPAIWALIADLTHPMIRGKAMSYGMAAFSIGQIIGVPIGGEVAAIGGWRLAFMVIAVSTLLLYPSVIIQLRGVPANKAKRLPTTPIIAALRNKSILFALFATFFWAAANLGAYAYLGVSLADRFGLSVNELGLTGIIVGFGSFFGALISGKMADKLRREWRNKIRFIGREEFLIAMWSLLLGIGVLISYMSSTFYMASVGLALWFIASGAFVTGQQTILSIFDPEIRGASLSLNNAIMYGGTASGVWLLGNVLDSKINFYVILLILCIAATIASALVSYMETKRHGYDQ